jgi:hypothetical protein
MRSVFLKRNCFFYDRQLLPFIDLARRLMPKRDEAYMEGQRELIARAALELHDG